MEVATTNNHSQSHHHHHHHHLQPPGAAGGSRSPFQREVREWQRIDPSTGALFSGRLEADRWINGPLNSYGKISDSQNISQPNGTQHTQRKQLEVLKARTANGAMQVIRTQTVQKSSSSWSSSTSTTTTSTTQRTRNSNGYDAPLKSTILPQIEQGGVDICELSDDCSLSGSDAGIVRTSSASASAATSASATTFDPAFASALSQELIDDHVDFVVINGEASDQDDAADEHLHKGGHNLLPDTAPSLKLSNLMKSSSSISSQSSNNSNLTTAAQASQAKQASNTHRSAGKISLHAIVGPDSSSSSSSSPLSASSSSAVWGKQADLYGQLPSGVGGSGSTSADADVAPPTHRRDLESFRHYNDDDGDDDLRLTARHQRRQQVSQSVYAPPVPSIGSTLLQRSRSISTDDLSNDWEREDPAEQPVGEWRRVSKLRRSFQSQDHYKSPATLAARSTRPLDLPGNSVSVARLRAELENGRRLHTAMRNNHVDLAALDNILNTPPTAKPTVAKRNTFLTAESLQEIRGKLKKLSDESLYKEDFLAYHQATKPVVVREISVEQAVAPEAASASAFRPVHNTHSLESQSRQRQKDTKDSSEWHLRRKSYGFEKMSPPEDKSIFRVDASTDSGLGRSGEQLGNWSPTERERERNERNAANQISGGGTIVHFGRSLKPIPSSSPTEGELSKRHSIAVEETWRDVRKTSQVHVNGGADRASSSVNSTSHILSKGSAQKRVEFCKTEVHFAAESGRVNIVETDGKPPPTQNFRRRRRTTASGPLQSLVKSASAGGSTPSTTSTTTQQQSSEVTRFGDDPQRRKTIATSTVAYRATLMDPPEMVTQPISSSSSNSSSSTQVTVTTVAKPLHEPRYSQMESTSRNSYTSTSGVDTTDNETDELSNIRGILKNKPVKPKPYHLGENIESADVLWSVPAMKVDRESPSARDSGIPSDSPISPKSVAERIRIVEQRQQHQQPSPAGNGYSTKINVSLGSEEWTEPGTALDHHPASSKQRQFRRPSAQELLLEDLRQHQRILDEGLKSTSLIMRTMRSASEFDEAMRRLSIASIESALVQPTIVVPTPMLRSHSYQEDGSYSSSRRPSTVSTTSITSSDLFGSALYDSLPRTPLAPPRLKLLGNTQIPVSQQLNQLRRLYDAAEQDQEDSADEEVKRYFRDSNSDSGGGTQGSSSPDQQPPAELFKGCEYSSSWSRMKAKRTIWKIEAQDQILQRADLPKSNVMNIALHAPRIEKPKATPPTLRIGQLIPVAKPRTLFIQPQVQAQAISDNADESGSESLKIVKEARGARKLREHELSYFGVQQKQQQQQQQQQQTKLSTISSNPRRTLPSRSKVTQQGDEVTRANNTTTTTKWQLLNDRPDLLRHSSPQEKKNAMFEDNGLDGEDLDEDHCYENIATELTTTFRVKSPVHSPDRSRSPGSYERKSDLQRDAQILSEMTRNADQTLKALSDEAAIKDQRRKSCSLQRRSAKPLETIDEKVKVYPQSVGVARGTFASEARRNSRQSTPSPSRARSSSQSSIECCPRDRSRSSSRESMTHGGGSSDDQVATKQRAERLRLRTPKREKATRHEPIEVRVHRHSSKQRSSSIATAPGSSSLESKRSSHRHSREVDHSTSETKSSSGSRLVRSSRVADESRPRQSTHRDREKERDRERSRGTEKHREELTRSRGHSSRSRHSEHPSTGTRESSRPSKTRSSRSSHDTTTSHKKSTTTATSTTATAGSKSSKTTTHKPSASTTTTTAPPTHNELTHGKGTLNGHHHHQHQHSSSGKHHGSGHGHREQQPHHLHSLTTSSIAASRHQRDRHGKDRK
ncbi:serine-rich adhesin for platelets isoform X2 [Drosophila gunungcola]|uniref:serine-rich adhesin for platelets isoform X2 n=1 Tax=Drosophila gunungcola TaxID=103775 RepID=UPI0022E83236|nr:serine-rich adhesin for platelets isoform X2 [Drosophila gunungcola]